MHITIEKFAYLRTPLFGITLHNDQGGSCSSERGARSLKAAASHVWFAYARAGMVNAETPVHYEVWENFDANDAPVITTTFTTVGALLARHKNGHIIA